MTSGRNYKIMAAKKSTGTAQEIYAPKDVMIPARLGGGVLYGCLPDSKKNLPCVVKKSAA